MNTEIGSLHLLALTMQFNTTVFPYHRCICHYYHHHLKALYSLSPSKNCFPVFRGGVSPNWILLNGLFSSPLCGNVIMNFHSNSWLTFFFLKYKLCLTRNTPGISSIPKGTFLKGERTKEKTSQHVLSKPAS